MNKAFTELSGIQKVLRPLVLLVLLLGFYLLLRVYVLAPPSNVVSYTDANTSVLGLHIPKHLHFCGEKIPSNDFEIRKDLEKEFFNNSYWKSNSLALFHKAQRWFPYIEPILKQEGIPDDFKYVAVIESHLSNVRSSAGAAGFWQLVPGTAASFGLEVNAFVDERYDVEKSTRAACLLLKQAYKVFHSWTLTAAAYNRGIGGILRAVKQQKSNDYHKLILNPETGSFVYRVLAYKTLFSSPGHFGIKKRKWNYYPVVAYKTIKVDSTLHNLSGIANALGASEALIKEHNPWLLQNNLPNQSKKVYVIKYPKKAGDYSGYLQDLNPGKTQVVLIDTNSVKLPADTMLPATSTISTATVKSNTVLEKKQ